MRYALAPELVTAYETPPATPVLPVNPFVPADPVNPVPTLPVNPTSPVLPVNPAEPAGPVIPAAPDRSFTYEYADPFHRYSFELSASCTDPVSISANSPATMPVGLVSAVSADTLE